MKFEKYHQKSLTDEMKTRLTESIFPGKLPDLLVNVPQNKIRSYIQDKVDPKKGDPILESIIHAFNRPSFIIRDSKFDPSPSDTWNAILSPYISNLSNKISDVGRIELKNHDILDWAGTGFLIDEHIICTNRHVADYFVETTSGGYTWKINSKGKIVKARIDFVEEYTNPMEKEIEFTSILYIEPAPGPDLALFGVNLAEHLEPLELDPHPSKDDVIVTIGYPWKDTRVSPSIEQVMKTIFGDIYDVKRIAPGKIVGLDSSNIHHDCTTLGGNSGSAILEVETGKVVGLHYNGDISYNNAVSSNIILDRLRRIKRS
jgi:endonuclease G